MIRGFNKIDLSSGKTLAEPDEKVGGVFTWAGGINRRPYRVYAGHTANGWDGNFGVKVEGKEDLGSRLQSGFPHREMPDPET